jgi:hypothetical protein
MIKVSNLAIFLKFNGKTWENHQKSAFQPRIGEWTVPHATESLLRMGRVNLSKISYHAPSRTHGCSKVANMMLEFLCFKVSKIHPKSQFNLTITMEWLPKHPRSWNSDSEIPINSHRFPMALKCQNPLLDSAPERLCDSAGKPGCFRWSRLGFTMLKCTLIWYVISDVMWDVYGT